ncbi:MAG: 1-acyl-sn-glycerol-3-phosphate acyltransferase [Caenispirillum bisanense]|nr:1-acyl-sn-glycerol-3-phosphate acyltransferase [Caenispirillum bisanense]MCA1972566.1 1-acyl-sn-glycerol-3-phosphate acyltransferase [Caenispirillum sp.]
MGSQIGAAVRLLLFVLWTLLVIPPYALTMAVGGPYRRFARLYWAVVARITNTRIVVKGTPATERPLVMVANHTSYMDIVVLGSIVCGAFVAKSEVAAWPGFGTIAKLGRTVFVDRKRSAAGRQRDELVRRLVKVREPLIFFPEGTSNDGNRVLPFKTTLFNVAEKPVGGEVVTVQAVSIAYTRVNGLPMGWGWRPFYAWYGDMDLAPHLWALLGFGRSTVEVEFHPPVRADRFTGRRDMAVWCETAVRNGVARALFGRDIPADPPLPEAPADAVKADEAKADAVTAG